MSALGGHLSPEIQDHLQLPNEDRIRLIFADRFICHERVGSVIEHCKYLINKPSGVRPTGLLVTSESGGGKTAMAEMLKRRYAPAPATPESPATWPIVYFCMTDARDAKEIYTRMLDAWGYPHASRLTSSERRRKVLDLAKASQLRLIIIDEIQDVLEITPRQQSLALLAVKDIMNSLQVPVLALGTEDAQLALKANAHLKSRFKFRELPTWKCDGYFRNFLEAYLESLPLRRQSLLTSETMMTFIINHAGGRLSDIIERIQRAAALAIESGEERITKELFVRAQHDFPRLSYAT